MQTSIKNHWKKVYETKQPNEVSWTQEVPKTSLDFIHSFNLPKTAKIIDVGGGDSKLVDFLLDEGFEDVTVLDISGNALDRAKARLGQRASKVSWIESDVTEFKTNKTYDVWHDRATFHFLTSDDQITQYFKIVEKVVGGYLAIGTFSEDGPTKCSGLEIKQYSESKLYHQFAQGFEKIQCHTENHITPFKTTQNFLFCGFRKIGNRSI